MTQPTSSPSAHPLLRPSPDRGGDEREIDDGGIDDKGIDVVFMAAPSLNFALEQSGVPLVPSLRVTNGGAEPLLGARVELTLLPDLGPPQTFQVPALHGGESVELGPLNTRFPPERFRSVIEAEQATLQWRLRSAGGATLAQGQQGVQLLAHNEWPGFQAPPALLACFVLPNQPNIGALLRQVRDRVAASTGHPSLEGYPSHDPTRVAAIIMAVLEVFRDLGLAYIGGAASFETVGQKVRFPNRVLSEGMGNCLDLTLLVAGMLEQLRLAPLLVVLKGHIFPAVWLRDDRFPEGVVGDAARLRNLVELGEILPFDVTVLVAADRPEVSAAIAVARSHLSDDAAFVCAIDIRVARSDRFLPLPLRQEPAPADSPPLPGFPASDVEPAPSPRGEEETPPSQATGRPPPAADPISARLKRWSERLLDLTLRNRLLNFRPAVGGALPLLVPDLGRIVDGFASERSYELLPRPPIDPRDERDPELLAARTEPAELQKRRSEDLDRQLIHVPWSEVDLVRRAVELDRSARRDFEEGGACTLFVALGLLKWFESGASPSPRLAPLLLVPVRLDFDRRSRRMRIRRIDEEPTANITLAEKLRRDYAIDLPFLTSPEGDDSGVNIGALLRSTRAAVSRMPRWEVLEEAHLALFTFTRFLMWRDLEENAPLLLQNAVVRHLAAGGASIGGAAAGGASALPASPRAPEPRELDLDRESVSLPLVLDADSSQMVAIQAALRGRSFVLQGPPGTGKSQTITNLIGAALAEGKTVLFVSEKMAALEVVHRRLKAVGLESAVLELHSHKANKSGVVAELCRSLPRPLGADDGLWEERHRELDLLRGQLDGVVRALHNQRPLGLTLHQVGGRLLGLRDAPEIRLSFTDITRVDHAWLSAMSNAVDSLSVAGKAVEPVPSHPWRDAGITDWSHGTDEAVRLALTEVRQAQAELDQALRTVASTIKTPALGSLTGAEALADVALALSAGPLPPRLVVEGATGEPWPPIAARAEVWLERNQADETRRTALNPRWTAELEGAPLGDIHLQFNAWAGSFFLLSWILLFFPRRSLAGYARQALPDNARIAADLLIARSIIEGRPAQEAEGAALKELLGGAWDGEARTLPPLIGRAEALDRALRQWQVAGGSLPASVSGIALNNADDPRRALLMTQGRLLASTAGRLRGARSRLEGLVEASLGDPSTPDFLTSLSQQVSIWENALPRFRSWSLYGHAAESCRRLGLSGIVEAHKTDRVKAADLRRAVERALLARWCATFSDTEPLLRTFDGDEQDRRVERFCAVDAALLPLARARILSQVEARLPEGAGVPGSEPAILQRELRKQRGHLPLRKLLSAIPNLLPRVKPCLLMSPLSVAQYLPASGRRFDIVIFDEASQIGTHEAIGAIARGEQVVIVGDSKQLPPTTFFTRDSTSTNRPEEALPNENDIVELESILDEALAANIPELTLRWHYRSRHESLIAFSNTHSYENKLQIFPAARFGDPLLGLSLHSVPEGVYDKGKSRTNLAEAEALVAALVESLLATRPGERSFGVVTFSMPQQVLVADLLDLARGRLPEIEPHFGEGIAEPVFVKNLENVQGDERDEILFSVCYGPDETGRVWMNFGPLNRLGGERRLNVAITRARETLRVFSTLTADQIDLHRAPSQGARHLQAFLREAAARGLASPPLRKNDFPSPFEADLHEALSAKGWSVDCQVGTGSYRMDLAVLHPDRPGEYLLGVEGDGPTYRNAATVRDRDRLRPAVLQSLGWQLARVWSRDLLLDRRAAIDRLETRLQAALERSRQQASAPSNEAPPSIETTPTPALALPLPAPPTPHPGSATEAPQPNRLEGVMRPRAPVIPYRLAGLDPVSSDPETLYQPAAVHLIEQRILSLVDAEAPIAVEELYRRVATCWGATRMTDRVRRRLGECLGSVESRGKLDVIDDFVWAEGQDPEEWTVIRGAAPGGLLREPEQIPAEEAAAAALYVLRQNLSLPMDALIRETARLFGLSGRGRRVEERIAAGIRILCDRGRARRIEGRVELSR